MEVALNEIKGITINCIDFYLDPLDAVKYDHRIRTFQYGMFWGMSVALHGKSFHAVAFAVTSPPSTLINGTQVQWEQIHPLVFSLAPNYAAAADIDRVLIRGGWMSRRDNNDTFTIAETEQ